MKRILWSIAHSSRTARPRKGDLGILGVGREVEQDAVAAEILERVRIDVADRRVGPAVEQRNPVIIGADMHAPFVDPDFGRTLHRGFIIGRVRKRSFVFKSPKAVHMSTSLALHLAAREKCTRRG
jgi:hypothetical protein